MLKKSVLYRPVSDVSATPMTNEPEFLADLHADLLHGSGKLTDRRLHQVLHVCCGDVEIRLQRKRARDRRSALRALGTDVAQALDRIDRLLERRRDLRFDGLRRRADVTWR